MEGEADGKKRVPRRRAESVRVSVGMTTKIEGVTCVEWSSF